MFNLCRFSRPILHGLCTLGFAVRAIIRCICRGDPDMIKSISGRFLLHVYPGETLITEMWLDGLRYSINFHFFYDFDLLVIYNICLNILKKGDWNLQSFVSSESERTKQSRAFWLRGYQTFKLISLISCNAYQMRGFICCFVVLRGSLFQV